MRLFQRIQELVEDEDALVFVLIDEVESLTAARSNAMSGNEVSAHSHIERYRCVVLTYAVAAVGRHSSCERIADPIGCVASIRQCDDPDYI